MGNVLYLFGAGASAGAIPVVNQMSNEIAEDMKEFNHIASLMENIKYDFRSYSAMVDGILSELKTACDNYYSIDTYAKQLFLTDSDRFWKLKGDLCFFFTLRQILKNPDKRYDNFWASILEVQDVLPNNIRIVSWNYDFQLELTYLNMSTNASLKSAKRALQVHSPSEKIDDNNGFSIMKLNGSATRFNIEDNDIYYLCDGSTTNSKADKLKQLVVNYPHLQDTIRNKSELRFAWETSIKPIRIEHFVQDYRVLAVVGYSFPYFNRKMDKLLLDSLTREGPLNHLYIQDKNPEAILERMQQISKSFYSKKR